MSSTSFPSPAQADGESAVGIRVLPPLERIPAEVRSIFGDAIVPDNFDKPHDAPERANDAKGIAASAGTLLVFPEVRQLWQLYPHDVFSAPAVAVAVRNLDTLRLERTFEIPGTLYRGSSNAEWRHAVEPGKRVFLSASDGGEVVEVDLHTFEQKRYPYSFAGTGVVGQVVLRFGGFTFDPYDGPQGSLVALFAGPPNFGVANINTFVQKRDLATGTMSTARQVRSCNGALPATEGNAAGYSSAILTTPDYLYISCQRSGASAEVVRLARAAAYSAGSQEDAVVGPIALEANFADPQSGRIHLVTQAGEDWVFDTTSMSFIGVVAGKADEKSLTAAAYGFDPATGRVMFRTTSLGFGVAEGRFFPVPQARSIRRDPVQAHERIYSDPLTGRVFQLDGTLQGKHNDYTVYQVDRAPAPPPLPDPDANTVDRREEDGVTESRYFGTASGYGVRALVAKGIATVAPSPSVSSISAAPLITSQYVNSRCGYTDRELVAGRVTKTEYDTGSTAAQAMAAGIDERTKVDLDRPSRCDIYGKDSNGNEVFKGIFGTAPQDLDPRPGDDQRFSPDEETSGEDRWGRKPASCSSSEGGDPQTKEGTDPPPPSPSLGSSKVTCPVPGKVMEAFAESRLNGQLTVGHTWTHTKLWRDAEGLHSRAESVAKNIDFAGVVTIGEVRSVAESLSNGRPHKGSMSTHEIQISRVAVGGKLLCASCVSSEVLATLNTILAGRAQFRMAEGLDSRLMRGTPKGALTAVQKSPERQVSDQSLIGDFTNDVPALEVVMYNDHYYWGRARQLYQFAGVATVATYNISLQPFGEGGGGDGDVGSIDEAAEDGSGSDGAAVAGDAAVGDTTHDADKGGIVQFFRDIAAAILRGIRVFLTSPRQGLLLLTAWALLLLPGYLARRRRLLTMSIQT